LTAEWRHLLMLNFEIDRTVLRNRVPAGTELDHLNGKTLVSLVGFLFLNTRVLGLPAWFNRNFEEVNLRFYVRRREGPEWRRGVTFVKEIVPRRAVAALARFAYGENYVALPMSHRIAQPGIDPGGVEYSWICGRRMNAISAVITGTPRPVAEGSEAEFITEHYWGYTARRGPNTIEYQVEHPRWAVWEGSEPALDCDVAGLYGPEFVDALSGRPTSAFVADGSPVRVLTGKRIHD
jgi:uncharacterized protein YqjF (DUF2071 family)